LHRQNRITVETKFQQQQKNQFRIGCAVFLAIDRIAQMAFQPAAQPVEMTDLAVMHEAPATGHEGMAVGTAGKPAGGGAHMREKKARAYLSRQTAEVLVRPCGKYVPIEA